METVVIPFVVVVMLGNDNHVDFKTITKGCALHVLCFKACSEYSASSVFPTLRVARKQRQQVLNWLDRDTQLICDRAGIWMKSDLVQSLILKHNASWLTALSVTPTHFCVTLETTISHLASFPMWLEATGLTSTTHSACILIYFVIYCQYPWLCHRPRLSVGWLSFRVTLFEVALCVGEAFAPTK